MKKIKVGLIGAGWVARKHLEVIGAIEGIELAGITSRTKSKAELLAKEFNIAVCVNDTDSLIHQCKPDALLVLVSEDQIYDVVSRVIPYGITLFIEKPAGLTPKENLELANLAKQYSVQTMVGFNRRYYSIFHKGIKIINEHGPLFGVMVEGHERIWLAYEDKKLKKDVLLHWLFANSTHTIDLLRFFGGEAENVKSFAHSHIESRGDQFAAVMELESGAIGQYSAHWHSPGGWRVVLYGDGVTVEFKPLESGRWIDRKFEIHEIEPDEVDIRFKAGFYRQMEAFANLVRTGKQEWPMLDLEGSYKTMLLAEKISSNVSNRTLKPAKISL